MEAGSKNNTTFESFLYEENMREHAKIRELEKEILL